MVRVAAGWPVAAVAAGVKASAQAAAPVKVVATRIVFPDNIFLVGGFTLRPFGLAIDHTRNLSPTRHRVCIATASPRTPVGA